MTALPGTDRTRLAAVRRVLVALWRWLNTASQAAATLWRGRFLIVGLFALVIAARYQYGRWMGLLAAAAWVLVGAWLVVHDRRRGCR